MHVCYITEMNINDYTQKHSKASVAKMLGLTQAAVGQWVNINPKTGQTFRPMPIAQASRLEKMTSGEFTRQAQFPEDYWKHWPELPVPKTMRAAYKGHYKSLSGAEK